MAASCNHYYGHNAILARYAGLQVPRPIFGYLLHGWYPWFPWMPDVEVIKESVPRGFPVIAWSAKDRTKLRDAGMSGTRAIGAPFLYLLRIRGLPELPGSRSLVCFPFHTLPNASAAAAWGEYADYLESLTGFDRITVCLYYLEYADPAVRNEFERRGFVTVSNGSIDDPLYLDRFYDLVAKHTDVTSNRVSTAVIYGAAMARAASLGGPVPAVTRQQTRGAIPNEGARTAAFQREHFADLVKGLDPGGARRFGCEQLGADCLLGSEQLRFALGWSGPRRLVGTAAAATTALRRSLRGGEWKSRRQPI